MGSYLSIHNDTSDEYYVRIGPDHVGLQVSAAIFGVLLGPAVGAITAAALLATHAADNADRLSGMGYDLLRPGEFKRYGKMSLSLIRQASCIRIERDRSNPKNIKLLDEVIMRPISSGPTNDSDNYYYISSWRRANLPRPIG